MRALFLRALIASACALCVVSEADAAPQTVDWTVRGEALACRIETENLVITPNVREHRAADAARLGGEERLQILYDLAADDYVSSDAEAAATTTEHGLDCGARHDLGACARRSGNTRRPPRARCEGVPDSLIVASRPQLRTFDR